MKQRTMFTEENKKDYTILVPNMLPIHFEFLMNVFKAHGYNTELLKTDHPGIIDLGLKSVHNDTCYPALLVIGQMMDALKSGKYNLNKVALLISQASGGCRATNYIHLLRKALERNGLGHIPVISFNMVGLEENPGFKITLPMIREFAFSVIYGDLIMWLKNQTVPYEVNKGETQAKIEKWTKYLTDEFHYKRVSYRAVKVHLKQIIDDFASIECTDDKKVRVGIVGEVYIKFSPLGNNKLEEFLISEGAEVVMPGFIDFALYSVDAPLTDFKLYGGSVKSYLIGKTLKKYLIKVQDDLINSIKASGRFLPMTRFSHVKELVNGYIGQGMKMGEGWLLPAEMLELIDSGVDNIVCAQPFGCLPNHIVGKGMFRKIKKNHPMSNIVSIDYDPGASRTNQQNRIKLMLATAKKNQKASFELKGYCSEQGDKKFKTVDGYATI